MSSMQIEVSRFVCAISPLSPPLVRTHTHTHTHTEDGQNYTKTKTRYYRHALEGLRRAIASWAAQEMPPQQSPSPPPPFFILQLGDLLDGFAAQTTLGSEGTLQRLLHAFEGLDVHHCLGNHEFYNNPDREYWRRHLSCFTQQQHQRRHQQEQQGQQEPPPPPPADAFYFAFSPHPQFLFINLDTYDVSMLGSAEGSEERTLAEQYIAKNPNEDKNSPLNLEGVENRFVLFGGGVGPRQLAWLKLVLEQARQARQQVVVFSHVPLHPRACEGHLDCLLWNYGEVLEVLAEQKGLVKLCFAGHSHQASFFREEESGICFYTLDAPLEQKPPGGNAFSTARFFREMIEIEGHGANLSVTINL